MNPIDFSHPNAQPFEIGAGESALLLIHGFTGSPSHMRTVGDAVAGAGFSARGILLPGHGTSLEDMERSTGEQWLEACRTAFMEMREKYRSVAVCGLSLGGVLSLLLAEEFAPSAVILLAPAVRYASVINHLSPIAKHVMRVSRWKEMKLGEAEFLREYDIGYRGAPVSKVEDMTRLQRRARRGLRDVKAPLLVIQSHRDESVHRLTPEIITAGASSAVKEVCWVDRSTHVNTIGPDREYVNGRVIDFLQRFGV